MTENDSMDAQSDHLSELSELHKKLDQHFERMYALSELMDDMFCKASSDGFFVYLNKRWEEKLGWTSSEMLSVPWLEFVHVDDVEKTIDAETKMKSDNLINFENRYRCKDGSYRRLQWRCLKWNGGGTTYCIAREIDEAQNL